MNRKRTFALLLSLFLLLPLLSGPVRAETDLEQQLIDSCTYGQKVDISDHKLTEAQLEEVYYRLKYEGRLPWYASNEYTYYYSELTGLILGFEPILQEVDRLRYEQEVSSILAACVFEGMEDYEKALALHDHLVLRTAYDERYEKNTGYQLLFDGETVCAGYAELYQDLLLRIGIPCLQVESESMDHVWNLVQLDGSWYHVDLTWADPAPNQQGLVDHSYFLKTDDEYKNAEEPHEGWETDITCATPFPDAFWADIPSGILYTDADTCYYLREKELSNRLIRRTDKETVLYTEKKSYIDIGQGDYSYFHTGLSLRGGRLWLSSLKEVFSLDLRGKDKQTFYTHPNKTIKRYIGGCYATEDTLFITLMNHDGEPTDMDLELTPSGAHLHKFTDTVTDPTCLEPGYTTSLCDCGLTATGNHTAPKGHSWQEQDRKDPTPFSEGYADNLCTVCNATERQTLEKPGFLEWGKDYILVLVALIAIPVSILINKHSKFKR